MQINRTIDDTILSDDWTEARVTYSSGWVAQPNECLACIFQPEPNLLMDGTWHYSRKNLSDVGNPRSFNLTFPGTAIYVYGLAFKKTIFEHADFAVTNLSFTLDNQPSLPNYYADPLANGYQSDTLVYSQTNLRNEVHILQVSLVDGQDSPRFNAFLFDYANYTIQAQLTSDLPLPTISETISSPRSSFTTSGQTHHTLTTGSIAGIIFAVLALMGLVVGTLVFYFLRRKRKHLVLPVVSRPVPDPSPSTKGKPNSQGYFPDVFSPGSPVSLWQQTGSYGVGMSKQKEASTLRAELQRLEARNAVYTLSSTPILPAHNVARR